jgi:hypothetical protein
VGALYRKTDGSAERIPDAATYEAQPRDARAVVGANSSDWVPDHNGPAVRRLGARH